MHSHVYLISWTYESSFSKEQNLGEFLLFRLGDYSVTLLDLLGLRILPLNFELTRGEANVHVTIYRPGQ